MKRVDGAMSMESSIRHLVRLQNQLELASIDGMHLGISEKIRELERREATMKLIAEAIKLNRRIEKSLTELHLAPMPAHDAFKQVEPVQLSRSVSAERQAMRQPDERKPAPALSTPIRPQKPVTVKGVHEIPQDPEAWGYSLSHTAGTAWMKVVGQEFRLLAGSSLATPKLSANYLSPGVRQILEDIHQRAVTPGPDGGIRLLQDVAFATPALAASIVMAAPKGAGKWIGTDGAPFDPAAGVILSQEAVVIERPGSDERIISGVTHFGIVRSRLADEFGDLGIIPSPGALKTFFHREGHLGVVFPSQVESVRSKLYGYSFIMTHLNRINILSLSKASIVFVTDTSLILVPTSDLCEMVTDMGLVLPKGNELRLWIDIESKDGIRICQVGGDTLKLPYTTLDLPMVDNETMA